jgi:hypothetical protein
MKGSNIGDAYEQIAYVINHRQEYTDIVSHLASLAPGKLRVREASVIVTTGQINASYKAKLGKAWGISPAIFTVQKTAGAAPDLRKYL